jgi:hypothetical protein
VSNLVFYYNNKLDNSVVGQVLTLKSGTGGGAPALDQNNDFLMSNLNKPDVYSPWKSSASPPDPLNIDFGATLAQNIIAIGYSGMSTGWPTQIDFYYSSGAYSGGSPPATLLGTLTPTAAGARILAVTSTSVRSLRIKLTGMPANSIIGKFVVLTNTLDLAMEGGPGSGVQVNYARSHIKTPSGVPVITTIGRTGRIYTLEFPTILTATRTSLLAVAEASAGGTLMMVDTDGVAQEVFLSEERFAWARVAPGVEQSQLLLETMP